MIRKTYNSIKETAERYKHPLYLGRVALTGLLVAGAVKTGVDLASNEQDKVTVADPITWVAAPATSVIRSALGESAPPPTINPAAAKFSPIIHQADVLKSQPVSPAANARLGDISQSR